VVVDENGNCSSISRGNKELWNMERIFEQVKSLGLRDVVFDGEAIARNFGEAMSITKTQTAHKNQGLLKFQIFDLLTGDEFRSQKCTRPLIDRKSMLKEIFESGQAPNLIHTDYILTDSVSHLQEVHEQYCLEGYEGSVFKHTESPYLFDRSDLWLKVKPECEGDLKITGAEEGSGRLRGTLGALWVEGEVEYKKSKYDVVSKVGTGFSDSDRDRLWSLYQNHQLLGEIVEVKFQDVTSEVSMGTSRASLRFPKFSKIRNDK
jgi:DNA ligase-1